MQKEVDNILVEIPEALPARVGEALSQVRAIHRRRVLRRLGGAVGSVVAVLAATVTLAAVNPALASQIPLVGEWLGGLFYEAGHDSKPGTGGAFIGTYSSVLEDVEVPAATENGEWGITFRQGYTDGHKVMLSLSLTGPQGDLERYSSVLFAGYGQTSTATINGETAQIQGVNSFEEREGSWDTTMAVVVPESQQEAETLEVAVTLQGLEGQMAELGAHGEVKTISTEPIQGSFSASFTLTVDHSNDYAFVSQAEDNRAKVFAVSGTPTQTVVSVEIPFWGYRNFGALEEDGVKGSARLVLPDGTQLRPDDRRSADLGGYDYRAAKTQSCDLYFDGLPAGTSQVELEFFWQEVGTQQEEVLASFTLDLANQEITAAGTQGLHPVQPAGNRGHRLGGKRLHRKGRLVQPGGELHRPCVLLPSRRLPGNEPAGGGAKRARGDAIPLPSLRGGRRAQPGLDPAARLCHRQPSPAAEHLPGDPAPYGGGGPCG